LGVADGDSWLNDWPVRGRTLSAGFDGIASPSPRSGISAPRSRKRPDDQMILPERQVFPGFEQSRVIFFVFLSAQISSISGCWEQRRLFGRQNQLSFMH